MKRIWNETDKIARGMRKPINTSAISIMGVYTFLWGLWLALPWNSFARSHVYEMLSNLAPELVWGIIAMLIGLYILRGVGTGMYKALHRGALAGFYYWFVIAGFYFIGDWHSTAWINAIMIASYCAFVAINLRVNKHIVEPELHDNNKVSTI